jgi:hypothetical protein
MSEAGRWHSGGIESLGLTAVAPNLVRGLRPRKDARSHFFPHSGNNCDLSGGER